MLDAHPHPALVIAGCATTTALIAAGDHLTGPYLVFSTFYLIPVAAAAWYAGRTWSFAFAAAAAVTGALSTALDPGVVPPAVIAWNGLVRFVLYVVVAVLVSAERDALAQIRESAGTDPLTQLANRRRFYDVVAVELARSRRARSPIALVYIDVDELKQRNDTYGHEAGDAMLVEFADLTRATLRTGDVVARVGGDEFCILLPDTDRATAQQVMERVTARLRTSSLMPIHVSAGVIAGVAPEGIDVEGLVHRADELMLEAKRSGKGRTCTDAFPDTGWTSGATSRRAAPVDDGGGPLSGDGARPEAGQLSRHARSKGRRHA
jgi:diguanylate cyclase (GGDEF)-like protein